KQIFLKAVVNAKSKNPENIGTHFFFHRYRENCCCRHDDRNDLQLYILFPSTAL
ncbi:hypothetical protein TNCV_2517471, partial [Trichonephila clavipes]